MNSTFQTADSAARENTFISLGSTFSTTTTGDCVGEVLHDIRTGKYREQVERIRAAHQAGDFKTAQALKQQLPAAMWSGRFSARNAKSLEEHSGLICVDIDDVGDRRSQIKSSLKKDPHVLTVFESPTDGLKAILVGDPTRPHAETFHLAERYLQRYNFVIDRACKDVARLCYLSWDPDLYVNFAAVPLSYPPALTPPPKETPGTAITSGPAQPAGSAGRPLRSVDEVRSLLARIRPSPPYGVWLEIASAVWSVLSKEEGCRVLDEWSPEKPGGYEKKWADRLHDFQYGTLVHYAEKGWLPAYQQPDNAPGHAEAPTGAGTEATGVPTIYYDPPSQKYWIQNDRRGWITVNEEGIKRQLRRFLRPKAAKDEVLSPLDIHLNELQTKFDVAYAGPLAGTNAGIHETNGCRVLITTSPTIILPGPGDWPTLRALIENMLTDERGDQTRYFYGWIKVAREALLAGKLRPGQALVIAGPHDSGKSLLQNLITLLLGGRAAKPYNWMTGVSNFNSELFGTEHLMIEDEVASVDFRARQHFGAYLKQVTVNTVQECHAKYREKIIFKPFWRLSITLNSEPENLLVLPVIDVAIEDKLILLRANPHPMPMATTTIEERDAFQNTLIGELPAFCAFLAAWDIPADLKSGRFGITHYHHPELLSAIDALAPETRLWALIVIGMFGRGIAGQKADWTGTAEELERELTREHSPVRDEAKKLLQYRNTCGTYLGRLSNKHPEWVINKRTADARLWVLKRPAGADGSGVDDTEEWHR